MKCRNKYCVKHCSQGDGCQYTLGIYSPSIIENCDRRKLYERDRSQESQSSKKLRELIEDNQNLLDQVNQRDDIIKSLTERKL